MRFKNKEDKFCGHINEFWDQFKKLSERRAIDYQLSNDQKLQFLRNVLSENALNFFNEEIIGKIPTFKDAIKMLDEKFNSIQQQNRVNDSIFSVDFKQF